MNRDYGESHFTTQQVTDTKEGYAGLELYRKSRLKHGDKIRIARILFWDASGQFYFETFNTDIPVRIVEDLIAEAKDTVKIR
jgi:hypothetical protein